MVIMEIIKRKNALLAGLLRYFTGKPCKYGHVDEHFTSTGQCCICATEYSTVWRKENREKLAPGAKRYRNANPERVRDYKRREYDKNRLAIIERVAQYRAANPEKINALGAARRARKRNAVPSWFGEFDGLVWEEATHLSKLREAVTGTHWHADHMIPLASRKASGLHVANNCQVIPERLNLAKSNCWKLTEPGEWIREA